MSLGAWKVDGWTAFGLIGNVAFTSRFFVQWICSERAGKTVIPMLFWYLSITGATIMLIYFSFGRQDIPGVLGYVFTLIPYVRNIMLTKNHEQQLSQAQAVTEAAETETPVRMER